MDELGEFIGGILIAVLLIVAAIYIFVYIVLPVAVCYYLGKQFYSQVKGCELRSRALATLAGIGFASIAVATSIVYSNGYEGIVVVPVSIVLFLIASTVTLSLWVSSKKKKFTDVLQSLNTKQSGLDARSRQIAQLLERLRKDTESIQSMYGERMREKAKLEGYLRELCESDARTYSIKRREWITLFKGKSDRDLDRLEQELSVTLRRANNGTSQGKVENSIKLCIVKIEFMNRELSKPDERLAANSAKMQELTRQAAATREENERVGAEIQRSEAAYAAFTSARIVLD